MSENTNGADVAPLLTEIITSFPSDDGLFLQSANKATIAGAASTQATIRICTFFSAPKTAVYSINSEINPLLTVAPTESGPRSASPNSKYGSAADHGTESPKKCLICGEKYNIPKTAPPLGTALSCPKCHAPILHENREGAGTSPEVVKLFLGYSHCSLGNPICPSCRKINFNVVFPDNGYALPWYCNTKPQNPEGFFLDIRCVHCGSQFVVEWDDLPIKDRFCSYCSALGCGVDFVGIPESRRQDFELDYGRPPQLPSPIKKGNGEALWLICPPCLTSANQGRYRKLISAAKTFADDELARGQTLPATIPLRLLVSAGYIALNHVRNFHGLDVSIPLRNDHAHPYGPCIRVQVPNGSAIALLSNGRSLDWEEYSRTMNIQAAADKGSGRTPDQSEFDSLVAELVRIGREAEDPNYCSFGFLRRRDSVEDIPHPRAKEIGRRLYDIGNRTSKLMRQANEMVGQALGNSAASALSCCWDRIGEEDCHASKGEIWMH